MKRLTTDANGRESLAGDKTNLDYVDFRMSHGCA